MNHLQHAEQSFVTRLIEETRALIKSHRPVHEKIARLQFAAAEQGKRAYRLRRMRKVVAGDPTKVEKVDRLLEVRERAMAYFRATAKYLTVRSRHPKTIVQMPRFFAAPTWTRRLEASHPRPPVEYPFMEYSS